jgi:hypothetical protein
MSGYACKACGATVHVDDAGVRRTCDCNTTVVASMSAVATGDGGASERNPAKDLLRVFHDIGLSILKGLRGGRV